MCSRSTLMGRWPTACTASVWKRTPALRHTAPISSMGWMVPISLLAYITVTRRVSGRIALLHLLGRNQAAFMHVQVGHGKSFLLQGLEGVQHGVVLKGGGNDVALALARSRRAAVRMAWLKFLKIFPR